MNETKQLERLCRMRVQAEQLEARAAECRARVRELTRELAAAGVRPARLAEALGVIRARVSQLLKKGDGH